MVRWISIIIFAIITIFLAGTICYQETIDKWFEVNTDKTPVWIHGNCYVIYNDNFMKCDEYKNRIKYSALCESDNN